MDESSRLTKTKEQWAKARRGGEEREVFYEGDARLPPGQHLVETWPVLDLGQKPEFRSRNGNSPSADSWRIPSRGPGKNFSPSPSSRTSQTSTV